MANQKNNLKGLKLDELKKNLMTLRENLRVLHFKSEGSKSKNVKEHASLRKQIARVLTEINKNNINKKLKK
ncbi:50S ribosomal protein L29 [Candidatus Nomurabacteria bacterium CG10_big_fil_rev_8_21_14_0_10_35_16]|jgi:ribosomal protein L29|uniref:Large ribosomal subunit protein uL29 n=1 Tax=Candidatus Nomurabacteria bacterium CG10_big_fil_rev_8_21_14_0_10_35_16 TaxID=1974731 RepID=A0A2H0TB73_9BACT|nr:MAG: 50S ribosomal protein L29 [Candidatus Nomurabacteria bacterium CG10_big_fil_rev_8_21_14_0_10_35_16]